MIAMGKIQVSIFALVAVLSSAMRIVAEVILNSECWIKLGMKWWYLPAPAGWNPLKQLKDAGLWSPLLPPQE